jgi:hypothetical protein
MATFPSKVNYATGDILTATNMNEIGQAINLLDGAQTSAAKNRVLNSNMSVWQRGTSIALGAGTYTADRWYGYRGVAGSTISRQVTNDTTNLPFIQYCARVQRDSGNTSTSAIALATSFESINSIPLAGKAVTFSFYARAGANFSQAANTLTFSVLSGTGTDQNAMFGYTGQATVATTNAVLTTTWQRFTASGTVAATATEIGIKIGDFTPVGTAGANDYFEVTGVQLEAANTASPYAPNGANYGAELAACRYYYSKFDASTSAGNDGAFSTGLCYSATVPIIPFSFPQMRVRPSFAASGTFELVIGGSVPVVTALGVAFDVSTFSISMTGTVTGLVAGQACVLRTGTSTAGVIELSAEL